MNQLSKGTKSLIVLLIGFLTIDFIILFLVFPSPPGGHIGQLIGAVVILGVVSLVLVYLKRKTGLVTSIIFVIINILCGFYSFVLYFAH